MLMLAKDRFALSKLAMMLQVRKHSGASLSEGGLHPTHREDRPWQAAAYLNSKAKGSMSRLSFLHARDTMALWHSVASCCCLSSIGPSLWTVLIWAGGMAAAAASAPCSFFTPMFSC